MSVPFYAFAVSNSGHNVSTVSTFVEREIFMLWSPSRRRCRSMNELRQTDEQCELTARARLNCEGEMLNSWTTLIWYVAVCSVDATSDATLSAVATTDGGWIFCLYIHTQRQAVKCVYYMPTAWAFISIQAYWLYYYHYIDISAVLGSRIRTVTGADILNMIIIYYVMLCIFLNNVLFVELLKWTDKNQYN